MEKLLVLTSSFPKDEKDTDGNFVKVLSHRLSNDFEVHVLVPYSHNSLSFELLNQLNIHRYKYWFGKKLLGDGKIMANLKHNKLFYLQVIPFIFYQILALRKIVKENSIKLIHAHWLIPQTFVSVVYKKFFNKKIKILATIHGGDINSFKDVLGGRLLKFVLNNIDELSVVSESIKKDVLKLGFKKKIYVFPMGVDTNLFSPVKINQDLKLKYNIDGFFLLFVGAVIYQKGINHLIKAMKLIVEKYSNTKLVVVGDGNLLPKMKLLTKELNIEKNIIFIGKIPNNELPQYFATSDLFILPSYSEGFGLVYAEAMSCETIALASNLESVHDIITHEETGFFLNEITSKCISENVISIIEKQKDLEIMKVKARNHIITNFDWEIVANNYSKLLNKICNG